MTSNSHAADRRRFVTRAGKVLNFTALGFGSAPLGNYLRPLSEEDCNRTLSAAWDSGARYFDTAPLYGLGLSEMRVGRLLSKRKRQDFIIATKVGRLLLPCEKEEVNGLFFVETPQVRFIYDYSYDGVMRSYEESLKRLGLDRVEILYVHDVCALVHGGREQSEARIRELIDTGGWRALTELRDSGDVLAIGAGVNEWEPCARLLELVDPDLFLLAGRYTLLEQMPIDTLFPQCAQARRRNRRRRPVQLGDPRGRHDLQLCRGARGRGRACGCAEGSLPQAWRHAAGRGAAIRARASAGDRASFPAARP